MCGRCRSAIGVPACRRAAPPGARRHVAFHHRLSARSVGSAASLAPLSGALFRRPCCAEALLLTRGRHAASASLKLMVQAPAAAFDRRLDRHMPPRPADPLLHPGRSSGCCCGSTAGGGSSGSGAAAATALDERRAELPSRRIPLCENVVPACSTGRKCRQASAVHASQAATGACRCLQRRRTSVRGPWLLNTRSSFHAQLARACPMRRREGAHHHQIAPPLAIKACTVDNHATRTCATQLELTSPASARLGPLSPALRVLAAWCASPAGQGTNRQP